MSPTPLPGGLPLCYEKKRPRRCVNTTLSLDINEPYGGPKMPVEDDIGDSTPKSKTRKQISTRTRFEIFKRDGFTCQYCGATPPDVVLHVDHILAVANGGTNDHGNLATSCSRCNFGKSAVPLESVPKTLGVQAKEAADRADQMKAYAELIQEARDADEDALWAVAEVIKPGASAGYSRDKCKGISNFIKKIGFAATLDAAHIASDRYGDGSRRFRYFCGICWNRVKEQSP